MESLWNQMVVLGKSWFLYDNLETGMFFIALALAIAFGVLWLCAHWPPVFRKYWA